MRYPTSYIYRVAMYAYHVCGLKNFTSFELYCLGPCAREWYTSQLPFDCETERRRIILEHGYTEEQWDNEMSRIGSFYWVPEADFLAVNRDVRAMFKPYFHINRVAESRGYNTACINNARKRGIFEYVDRTRRSFLYRINPKYLDDPRFPKGGIR